MKTKDEKRAEAEARQAAHDELTRGQQLGKLAGRPGDSRRERGRILDDLVLDEFD
ncbi:hypothetical protein LJR186_001193 [Microbacterium foliorum]